MAKKPCGTCRATGLVPDVRVEKVQKTRKHKDGTIEVYYEDKEVTKGVKPCDSCEGTGLK